jgi:hypothetical protein
MPARDENLADHFIRSAGIAGVYVDADGAIGAVDHVSMFGHPDGRVMFCCARGNHAKVAALAGARIGAGRGQPAGMAAVREAAAEMGIGLTPHDTVIQRAFAAVGVVNAKIEEMQKSGDLKELNRDFKAARTADPKLR